MCAYSKDIIPPGTAGAAMSRAMEDTFVVLNTAMLAALVLHSFGVV